MSYRIHEQYVDMASGFHVIELRDGKKVHFVQISVGADACPACGHVTPKNNLAELDPKALVAEINQGLDKSQEAMTAYAKKHGLTVK
jgi:uncharacterized protein (UPF0212 family)